MKRRVAITGIGLVTPCGNDVATTWNALLTGRSGTAPITLFDARGFSTRIAAEVKGFDEMVIEADRKLLKFANRSHRFALAAAEQAFRDAGIMPTADTGERWSCAVGTGMMGVDFADLAAVHRHSAASGELNATALLSDPAADAPLRHSRLCNVGAHCLRIGRSGDRHCAQIDSPGRRGLRARRRFRFDDQSRRIGRLLFVVCGVHR